MIRRSLAKRLWYNTLRIIARIVVVTFFGYRFQGRQNVPKEGGGLVCSNHQSHFDPVFVGLVLDRRLNYLARKTLFTFLPFRWLIQSLDAISIDREGSGLSGLKETLRRVRQGEFVLLFPEGTRTKDGKIGRFKSGVCTLARRGKVPLIPVGISGAFEAWPRKQRLPRLAPIRVCIGPAISPEEISSFTDEQILEELRNRIEACHQKAKMMI